MVHAHAPSTLWHRTIWHNRAININSTYVLCHDFGRNKDPKNDREMVQGGAGDTTTSESVAPTLHENPNMTPKLHEGKLQVSSRLGNCMLDNPSAIASFGSFCLISIWSSHTLLRSL